MRAVRVPTGFKKLLLGVIGSAVIAGSVAGCGTVRLEVPAGYGPVRMLEADEPAEIRVERTVWFWLWGGKPISDNTTKTDVETHKLQEVRLRTEQNLLDNILLPFTAPFSVVRRTLIVEGNAERALRRNRGEVEW